MDVSFVLQINATHRKKILFLFTPHEFFIYRIACLITYALIINFNFQNGLVLSCTAKFISTIIKAI
jgi:hypothetical protein